MRSHHLIVLSAWLGLSAAGAGARAGADPAPPAETTATAPAAESRLSRRELNAFLDLGPGRFLQQVDVRAVRPQGRFTGWRVMAFFPGDPRFAGLDLRPGDVVLRVNGQTLERPEQLSALWSHLRTARELVVELGRGAGPNQQAPVALKTLRWTIVDDGATMGASSDAHAQPAPQAPPAAPRSHQVK